METETRWTNVVIVSRRTFTGRAQRRHVDEIFDGGLVHSVAGLRFGLHVRRDIVRNTHRGRHVRSRHVVLSVTHAKRMRAHVEHQRADFVSAFQHTGLHVYCSSEA